MVNPLVQSTPLSILVQALRGSLNIDDRKHLLSAIKGDSLCIKIIHEAYDKGLASCKKNLHGRKFLKKGDKPYTAKDLVRKLTKLWNTTCKWKMISLEHGFYDFQI